MPSKMTYEYFVEKAQRKNGNKYIYPIDILDTRDKDGRVGIICPVKDEDDNEHGLFWQTPSNHFKGCGCPKCGRNHGYTTEEFKEMIRKKYPDSNIILDEVEYVNYTTSIKLICPEHGSFTMYPSSIKDNIECPECQKKRLHDTFAKTTDEFISEIENIFGNDYDYSEVEYVNNKVKVKLSCKEHGVFYRPPLDLINGKGCPKCGRLRSWDGRRTTTEQIIQRAKEKHGDRYDYSETEYILSHIPIKIHCNKCGNDFYQNPHAHVKGQGCPICNRNLTESDAEIELSLFLSDNVSVEILKHARNIIFPLELDLYIPNRKIAIEFDGLYWHSNIKVSNDYHLNKTTQCENNGIRLIHIFEDEWMFKKDIVKSMLLSIIGNVENKISVDECVIDNVDLRDAIDFLNDNHIEGYCESDFAYGLSYKDELVYVMTFRCVDDIGHFEITRSCNKINTIIDEPIPVVLNYFIEVMYPNKLSVYIDRRWNNGNEYQSVGFSFIKNTEPNCYKIVDRKRNLIEPSDIINENDKKTRIIFDCGYSLYEMYFR